MLNTARKYLGPGTMLVLVITLALFILALFVKGVTHDLLLEAAVFLVSVKLIVMTYRNSKGVEAIQAKLDKILTEEEHLEKVLTELKNRSPKDRQSGVENEPRE